MIAVHEKLWAISWPVKTVTSPEEAYAFLRQCGAPCRGTMQGIAA